MEVGGGDIAVRNFNAINKHEYVKNPETFPCF